MILFKLKALILVAGLLFDSPMTAIPNDATAPCPKGSKNCIRTTWTPKKPMKQADAIRQVRDSLSKYPQEGQDGVDKGGWKLVDDKFGQGGSTRVEFRSGVGKFAWLLNFGQPFVDDLLLKVQEDGKVEVRSSSRKGMSDMGVNKKRVQYLASSLPSSWDAPEADYSNN